MIILLHTGHYIAYFTMYMILCVLYVGAASQAALKWLQIQKMTKVESEREDLRQENSRLQAEVRRLQRDRSPRAAQGDAKLQEQVQALLADKAALQEQLQQAQKSPTPAGSDQGYTNTWKLVDTLTKENRWGAGSTGCIALCCEKFSYVAAAEV